MTRKRVRGGGWCRCCGAEDHEAGQKIGQAGARRYWDRGWMPDDRWSDDFPVYKAGLVDSDGVYYAALCESCFDAIEAEISEDKPDQETLLKRDLANAMLELMPEEYADGIVTELEDLDQRGLV